MGEAQLDDLMHTQHPHTASTHGVHTQRTHSVHNTRPARTHTCTHTIHMPPCTAAPRRAAGFTLIRFPCGSQKGFCPDVEDPLEDLQASTMAGLPAWARNRCRVVHHGTACMAVPHAHPGSPLPWTPCTQGPGAVVIEGRTSVEIVIDCGSRSSRP